MKFNLSLKRIYQDMMVFQTKNWVYLEKDVKRLMKEAKKVSDDAGHLVHDTKVIRLKDLKELLGDKLK